MMNYSTEYEYAKEMLAMLVSKDCVSQQACKSATQTKQASKSEENNETRHISVPHCNMSSERGSQRFLTKFSNVFGRVLTSGLPRTSRPWGLGFGVQMPTRPPGVSLDSISRSVVDRARAGGANNVQANTLARRISAMLGRTPQPQQVAAQQPAQPTVNLFRGLRLPFQRFTTNLNTEKSTLEAQLRNHITTGGTSANFPAYDRLRQLRSIGRPQYFYDNFQQAASHAGPSGQVISLSVPRNVALQNTASNLRDTTAIPALDLYRLIRTHGLRSINPINKTAANVSSPLVDFSKTPKNPYLVSLLRAKAESDIGNYRAKHKIMRRMLLNSPSQFIIDSQQGNIVGITHKPTGFRMHIPAHVLPVKLEQPLTA